MKEIPLIPGHFLWGHARELSKNPLTLPAEMANNHGGAVRFRILHRPFLGITDPVLARHILQKNPENYPRSFHYRNGALVIGRGLLTEEGQHWQRSRRMMQPTFRSDPVREIAEVTATCWHDVEADCLTKARTNEPVDMAEECQRLALDIIMRTLCSIRLDKEQLYHFGTLVSDGLIRVRKRNNSIIPAPTWLPTPNNKAIFKIKDEVDRFLEPLISRHIENPQGNNMLSLLAKAEDEQGNRFSHQELLDETKTLFAAGFETTATGMAWVLCELADRPELCDRLAEEAATALNNGAITRNTIDQLPLAGRVIDEVLRLYPPVYNLGRRSIRSDTINGLHIPGNTNILISVWGMHRAPCWGDTALQFDADRWLPERHPVRDAYMPFASGRHTCIGIHFAQVEMRIMVALISNRFRLHWAVGHNRPKVLPRITAAPDGPVCLRLEPR